MASESLAEQTLIVWLPKRDWWEQQRDIIVTSKSLTGITRKTTLEEYQEIIDLSMKAFTEMDVPFHMANVNPAWVKQELQATRKPMTRQNVAAILYDPIGIERIGFKSKW